MGAVPEDCGPSLFDPLALYLRSIVWEDYRCLDPNQGGRQGQGCAMISRGRRHHTLFSFLRGQHGDCIICSPELKRTSGLQGFELKIYSNVQLPRYRI